LERKEKSRVEAEAAASAELEQVRKEQEQERKVQDLERKVQEQELERLVLPGQVLPLGLPLGLPALLRPPVLQLGQPLFWQLLVAWRLLMRPRAPVSSDRFPEPREME
jgi:hypothetical protein